VGKLVTRAVQPDGRVTFYGHEKAGAEAARRLGARLRLSNSEVERLEWLVGMHMSLTPGRSKKALRRWLAQRGEGWVRDLVALCRADARASGWEGALPHIERIEREIQEIAAKGEALTRADLAVDGRDVMRELGIGPGPRVGRILARLYERVLEDPELNTRAALLDLLRRMAQDQET